MTASRSGIRSGWGRWWCGRSISADAPRADRELALAAPLLLVLGTAGDTAQDRLAAGQALASVLLRAAADGVDASYFNQPVQVASLRHRLIDVIDADGWPQVVLRLGHGPAVPPSPRRPLDAVLEQA